MKPAFVAGILLLSFAAIADAFCPNGCSGHGQCGVNDKCTCFLRADGMTPAWVGGDCSLRTCPTGAAWVDVPTSSNVAHALVECSNRGDCNRKTGQCECLPGYSGMACDKLTCPNGCSGKGVCQSQKSFANDASNVYTLPWDAQKSFGCKCDVGYRGADCSLIECPSAPDVLRGDGASTGRECGGRGYCRYDTGVCECFPGYLGTACTIQVSNLHSGTE